MKMMKREYFYEQIVKPLVDDNITYFKENKAQIGRMGYFSQDMRYIRIKSRRRIGYTYSGIRLMYDFSPSIIFVPNFQMRQYILRNEHYPLVSERQLLTYEQALETDRMARTDGRYKLAIIDVGYFLDEKNMRRTVLDALFHCWADFVVEFS